LSYCGGYCSKGKRSHENEEIDKKEYAYRYGECAEQDMELNKIKKIRGDAFTEFLKKTERIVRSRGKKFNITLDTELLREYIPSERHIAYPMTVEWQWGKWLDELLPDGVTICTYKHTPEFVLSDKESLKLVNTVKNKGIPMTYLRYITKSFIKDMKTIYNTGDFESIILYEVYQFIKSDENGGIIIKMPEFFEKVK
jgi:hypothetical protein